MQYLAGAFMSLLYSNLQYLCLLRFGFCNVILCSSTRPMEQAWGKIIFFKSVTIISDLCQVNDINHLGMLALIGPAMASHSR